MIALAVLGRTACRINALLTPGDVAAEHGLRVLMARFLVTFIDLKDCTVGVGEAGVALIVHAHSKSASSLNAVSIEESK